MIGSRLSTRLLVCSCQVQADLATSNTNIRSVHRRGQLSARQNDIWMPHVNLRPQHCGTLATSAVSQYYRDSNFPNTIHFVSDQHMVLCADVSGLFHFAGSHPPENLEASASEALKPCIHERAEDCKTVCAPIVCKNKCVRTAGSNPTSNLQVTGKSTFVARSSTILAGSSACAGMLLRCSCGI